MQNPNRETDQEPGQNVDEKERIQQLEQEVINELDTGDIILFSRQCNAMGVLGGALCFIAKTFSVWDHVAAVVKDPKTNEPYALEVSFRGVKLLPVKDRIDHSKAPLIAVRYLCIHRTQEMRERAWKKAKELEGKPYTTEIDVLARAGLTSPLKLYRSLLFNRSNHLQRELFDLIKEEQDANINDFLYTILQNKKQHLISERAMIKSVIYTHSPSKLENKERNSSYFCSQGTAAILKSIGVLPQNIPTTEYMPYSFSSDVHLPLLKGANFSPEIYLRGQAKDSSYEHDMKMNSTSYYSSLFDSIQLPTSLKKDTSLCSTDEVILNRIKLCRPFARLSTEEIRAMIAQGQIKHLLPGESINMEDPQYSAFLVQDGVIHINRWTSAIGERKIGIHGQDSVLGSVVFPEYEHVIARACSHLHSTILRLPEESLPGPKGDAAMVHGMERIRLIRYLKHNKHFQHLSFPELLMLTSYFYKAHIDPHQCLSRFGDYCDHMIVIDKGHLYQKSFIKNSTEFSPLSKTSSGNIFGCSTLIYGIPRRDYVYTGEEGVDLFCLDPIVFHYYTGEWCPSVMESFNEFQDPLKYLDDLNQSSFQSFLESLDVVKSISSVYTRSIRPQNTTFLSQDPLFKRRIHLLAHLMSTLFPDEQHNDFSEYINENLVHKLQAIYTHNQNQVKEQKQLTINEESLFPIRTIAKEAMTMDEFVEDTINQIRNILILRQFDNQSLIRVTDIFRMDETQAMLKVLYYAFIGKTESHTLSKEIFLSNGLKLGILQENDPLTDLLFPGETTEITSSEFNKVLKKHMKSLSPTLLHYIETIQEDIRLIDKDLPSHRRFAYKPSFFHPLSNPYGVLDFTLPVALPLTFSVKQRNDQPYLYSAVFAGLLGELIGSIMLFPTYVSALSTILNLTSQSKTLKDYLFKQTIIPKPRRPSSGSSAKAVKRVMPRDPLFSVPISASVSELNAPTQRLPPSAHPIRDQFSFLHGISKNFMYVFYRNAFEILTFPLLFRLIYDHDYFHSLPSALQASLAGFFTGLLLPTFVYPFKKKFQIQMLGAVEIEPLSFFKRHYRGLSAAMLYDAVFLSLFLGSFTFIWSHMNKPKKAPVPKTFNHNSSVHLPTFNGNSLLDAVTVGALTYTTAFFVSWPLAVYKRYKAMQGYQVRTSELEIVRFSKNYSVMNFFKNRTVKQLYRGITPRLYNGLLSVCLGIVFAGCGYRYAWQKKCDSS